MAKGSKKKKTVKVKMGKELSKEIAYLTKLVEISLNSANGASEELDNLFIKQAEKLVGQIEKLKENR